MTVGNNAVLIERRYGRMKIVIVGSSGRLGAALMREYKEKFGVVGFSHAQLDLAKQEQLRDKLSSLDFDVLINAAAFTNVDLCEKERDQTFRINAEAPRLLAEICRDKKAKLIHFSTDYVFDGEKREPYVETDPARPISVYGESKRAGEENVLAVPIGKQTASPTVIRVSWVFGPDRPSFIDAMIKRAREEERCREGHRRGREGRVRERFRRARAPRERALRGRVPARDRARAAVHRAAPRARGP